MCARPTVVVTRPRAESERLARALDSRRLRVIVAPAIDTVPVASDDQLRAALHLSAPVWVFVSPRAVDSFLRLRGTGRDPARDRDVMSVVGIGPRTVDLLEQAGLGPVSPPPVPTARGVLDGLASGWAPGCRVMWVCGDRADDAVPQALESLGFKVIRLQVYRHVEVEPAPVDWTFPALGVFASPSAVHAFGRWNPRLSDASATGGRWTALAIGPTTASACVAQGWPTRQAGAPTDAAIVLGVEQWVCDVDPSPRPAGRGGGDVEGMA